MPPTSLKLLIVDDEPVIRTLLTNMFSILGHKVQSAEDGFSALERIREAVPDVLLSDLNMPGMSGFELLSVVRRRLPEIYVIASSGAYSGSDVPQGIAADAFYEKASGVRSLLGLMADVQKVDSATPRGLNSETPMWIQRSRDEETGVSYALICCPECLRAFQQAVPVTNFFISETDCVSCGTPIHYAIVQPLDPATSQPFGRSLTGARLPESVAELFGDEEPLRKKA
jgi:CheY-like chemotaxis protein